MDTLLNFWFNPENEHIWFHATPEDDKLVTTKFGYLIFRFERELENMHSTELPTDPTVLLFFIILFDQVSRHLHRYFDNAPYPLSHQKIAHKCAFKVLKNHPELEPFSAKAVPFVLLPYRHSNSITYINYVRELSYKLLTSSDPKQPISYIRRFYQATLNQLAHQIRPTRAPPTILSVHIPKIEAVLDPESPKLPTELAILTPELKKHSLIRAILATLPSTDSSKTVPHIVVSVSGGKDSMALSTALAQIKQAKLRVFNLSAVHINYMNRDSSIAEEFLVTHHVSQTLKIPLHIRRIREIKRTRTSQERKFYEALTKTIRFQTYNHVSTEPTNTFVLLGHNEDDTIENIITNISKKKHYENLLGMKTFTTYSPTNTKLWRPLLTVSKREIEDFNQKTQTPFTYDSTPDWSDRGKIRDTIVPTLQTFKPALLEGLAHLSKTLNHLSETYETYTLPQILRTHVTETKKTIDVKFSLQLMTEKVMRDIFTHYNIPQPSHKSLKNAIQVLQRAANNPQTVKPPKTIVLTKSYSIDITQDLTMRLPLP